MAMVAGVGRGGGGGRGGRLSGKSVRAERYYLTDKYPTSSIRFSLHLSTTWWTSILRNSRGARM